ncbi:MAG: AraC family transcriptional regulator ligand-binding domain-containing protein [Pseudomonadota bacterium]
MSLEPAPHGVDTATSTLPIIPVRYFALLCDLLDAQGIDSAAVLRAAQIDPVQFNQPHAAISTRQVDALLAEAERASGRRDLGFEIGRGMKLNSHDILGYAMLSSPSCDHVLRLVSRYYRLMTPMFSLTYRRQDGLAEMLFRPLLPMPRATMRVYQEMVVVASYRHVKSLLQQHPARCDIYLSIEAPPHAARYRELAPAKVHFGASALPMMRLVMDAEQLDRPLQMADERARQLAEDRCAALLHSLRTRGSWKAWVGMMLSEAEDCQPKLEELAGILNISPRTLDRHLRKEDTTFRALSLRIRAERARAMLADGALPVSQIAYRLGYSDVANFSHAFHHAHGCSPSAWRAALARSPDSPAA